MLLSANDEERWQDQNTAITFLSWLAYPSEPVKRLKLKNAATQALLHEYSNKQNIIRNRTVTNQMRAAFRRIAKRRIPAGLMLETKLLNQPIAITEIGKLVGIKKAMFYPSSRDTSIGEYEIQQDTMRYVWRETKPVLPMAYAMLLASRIYPADHLHTWIFNPIWVCGAVMITEVMQEHLTKNITLADFSPRPM